ncbi:hypothetical protein F5890DRAFT_1535858 [Lentinula detonsa]|uniref:Uncharacterized protein n=1 Tax=Lentinula detonsa TaxID=2804962 RepID=A0AA38PTF3_9AGAR|nr:hypothetical protein F5890DRAFT_1535858 [Lentinula detonsa]
MQSRLSFLLVLLTVGHITAAYRPYRPHDNSNLAQPHHVPLRYQTDGKREVAPTQAPSPVNASIESFSENPKSSSHPSQIPSCPGCSPVASPAVAPPSTGQAPREQGFLRSSARNINTTGTPSVPLLAPRQIHNADYSSSNAPSSSADANSTKEAQPSSSATGPSATDSPHSTEKREDVEEDVQAERRLPRLVPDINSTASNSSSNLTGLDSPQRRASALHRMDIDIPDSISSSSKNNTSPASGPISTETNSFLKQKQVPRAAAMRRMDIPGFDQNSTSPSANSTETSSPQKRLSRASGMKFSGLTPDSNQNSTMIPDANSTRTELEDLLSNHNLTSSTTNGLVGHVAATTQPERRTFFRFRRYKTWPGPSITLVEYYRENFEAGRRRVAAYTFFSSMNIFICTPPQVFYHNIVSISIPRAIHSLSF